MGDSNNPFWTRLHSDGFDEVYARLILGGALIRTTGISMTSGSRSEALVFVPGITSLDQIYKRPHDSEDDD